MISKSAKDSKLNAQLTWTLSSSGPTAPEPIGCSSGLSRTMSSPAPVQQGGVVVVTQMYPTPPQGASVGNPIRQHMIALGAVQIMIGLMVVLFGVVALLGSYSLGSTSGFFAWGGGFYITAGSLAVAAGKSSNRCLMNTTLAFNMVVSIAAMAGMLLYAVDAAVTYYIFCDEYECRMYQIVMQGIGVVLTALHFLEFIITVVVAAFICKLTCGIELPPAYTVQGNASMVPQVPPSYSPSPATVVQFPPQGLPPYHPAVPTSMVYPPPMTSVSNPANGQSLPGFMNPPPYSSENDEEMKTTTATS